MSRASARLLLSGYYGFDNFGDETILRIFIEQWRTRRPADVIGVLSNQPARTSAGFGVPAFARMGHAAIVRAVRDADVLVSGGGGLLQSATSLRSLLYYTGVIHEAKALDRAAVIFAQGIGPLSFTARHVVRRACAGIDLAIVRDGASAQLLRELLPNADVRVGADPVFLANTSVNEAKLTALAAEGVSGPGPFVAVVVRPARALERARGEIARVVDLLSTQFGAQVVFVPFQLPADSEAAISIIRRCRTSPVLLGGGYDLETMTALFSRCAAIVAMRLHALILAARLAIPFLAIPYDPKILALCRELDYPLSPLTAGGTQESVEALWPSRASIAQHLKAAAARQEQRASASFDWLATFVEGTVS
jgi:polysaccharide pyruvyl transferase CsaB